MRRIQTSEANGRLGTRLLYGHLRKFKVRRVVFCGFGTQLVKKKVLMAGAPSVFPCGDRQYRVYQNKRATPRNRFSNGRVTRGGSFILVHPVVIILRVFTRVSGAIKRPKPNRPNEGDIYVNVEMSPMAAANHEAGRCVVESILFEKISRAGRLCEVWLQAGKQRNRNNEDFGAIAERSPLRRHGVFVPAGRRKGISFFCSAAKSH